MPMASSIDVGWTLIAGMLVFFMQAGFAMLEAGSVRLKNVQSIVMKNVIDSSIGSLAWFLFGYGFAFGTSATSDGTGGFLGKNTFGVTNNMLKHQEGVQDTTFHAWFFQFTFCATAATIVSGALAERTKLEGYCIFAVVMCAFIYPVIVHWTWGGGWLSVKGYNDFAGSGVVHLTGGISALIAASIVGPRKGRFGPDASPNEFEPSSRIFICLGTFILWFGWYGFNAGSTTALSDGAQEVAARCCVTTTVAAAAGGVAAFTLSSYSKGAYDVVAYANGILAGLVSITAGCSNVDVWAAFVIGLVGGVTYYFAAKLLEKLHIDDPIGAFPVHGACGTWGVIATGLLDMDVGLFYGAHFDDCLGPNIVGCIAISAWCAVMCGLTFYPLKYFDLLRVSPEVEERGMDWELATMDPSEDLEATTKPGDMAMAIDGIPVAEVEKTAV